MEEDNEDSNLAWLTGEEGLQCQTGTEKEGCHIKADNQ